MLSGFQALRQQIGNSIVGQHRLIEQLLIALLADGHALVEGVPGLAKTTAVKKLAEGMAVSFKRIQFTPDLIPGDITGTEILTPQAGTFEFVSGPIFNQVILADEINRAPPKVQSALLEAMQEKQVTVGGQSRPLPPLFLVIATQNPIEHEGTFPLPEAQLDRFLLKISLDYPSLDEELEIIRRDEARVTQSSAPPQAAALSSDDIVAARTAVNAVYLDDMLKRYITQLVAASREPANWLPDNPEAISRGASPRASLALARCARARAFLQERDFVEPNDIKQLAYPVLRHRLALSFSARAEGFTTEQIITQLLDAVPVP
jgi:MoxR-like ATPase